MNPPKHNRNGKNILVGVSGGIAAYKSPTLIRRLREHGCQVRVIMTRAAAEFITPLTLQAVSGQPVHSHLLDAEAESAMSHIELARWAEQIVIAPATANCIARLAHGWADDLLSAVVLATTAEVVVAPAMNRQMWRHPATQRNLAQLAEMGIRVIGPAAGDQACGESGHGRMTEPEEIAAVLSLSGAQPQSPRLLDGRTVLITAGPTWEALDPVRGLTNRSSGKMGYALAQAALDLGAQVTLISGPVALETPRGANRIDIDSARQMLDAALVHASRADLFIAVAAVADYRPAKTASHKIKKGEGDRLTLQLVKNPDNLAAVAALEGRPFTVGFAAESEDTIANARRKLLAKGVDAIAANHIGAAEDGDNPFGSEENSVTLIYRKEHCRDEIALAKTGKYRLAVQIIENIAPLLPPPQPPA